MEMFFLKYISLITSCFTMLSRILASKCGNGGNGGSASVLGSGTAIGGKAGIGGNKGNGGKGGDAYVGGDGFALGGEGGDSGNISDSGAKGGRGPFEILGRPNIQLPDGRWLWDIGSGGNGAKVDSNTVDES